ncbi:MAG TPA: HAMP domain-containing protein, partial [Gammaproteobacteria bacterium]
MVRSLQGRLLRALLSVALVTLLAGIAGVFSLHLLTARLEQLTLHTWPSTDAAQELSRSFHKGVGGLEQFLAGNRLTSRKTIADARARATTELARLVDSEAVTVGLAQELQQLFAQMTAIQDRLIGLKELDLQLERAIEDHWSRTHQQLERVIEVLAQDRATTADLLNAALELYRSLVPALDEHLGIDQAQLQHSIGWLRALPSYPWYRDALAPFTDGIDRLAALDREHVGNLHTIGQLRGEHERLVAQLERRLSRTEARLRKEMLDNATAGTALARDAQALLIGAVVVAAALAALLALYLSRLIGHPLNQLRDAVDELLKDRGRRVDIRTGDELQSLGTAFNRMAENLDATSVSRDYLDSIFASMLDGLFVVGRDGRVELANRAASDLLERPPESLRGVPLRDLLHLNGDPLGQASPPPTAAGEGLLRGSLEAIPVLFSLA